MTDRSGAFVEAQHAGQHLEQRAFPGTVFPYQRHALTTFDGTINAFIHHFFPIAFCSALEIQYLAATGCGEGKLELHSLGIALNLNHLDLFKLFDARLDLAGFVRLIAESMDKCLAPRALFRLWRSGCFTLCVPLCSSLFERGIIAAILFHLMVSKIPD